MNSLYNFGAPLCRYLIWIEKEVLVLFFFKLKMIILTILSSEFSFIMSTFNIVRDEFNLHYCLPRTNMIILVTQNLNILYISTHAGKKGVT